MNKKRSIFTTAIAITVVLCAFSIGCNSKSSGPLPIPPDIQEIFDDARYQDGIWGLRVVDVDTGKVIYNQNSDRQFLIGSVRKTFTIGLALEELGQNHMFRTPVHRQGPVDTDGVLNGDLILVADGDLTMGGRRNANGTMAVTDFDHNEANALGNAELSKPNPLAGYIGLAQQVAAAGITEITGDIIIDDRLFQPYFFRGEFDVRPIFVNDDVVDVIMNPTTPGEAASVDWRPISEAFDVESELVTSGVGTAETVELEPEFPQCIGMADCVGVVSGDLPIDFVPSLTNAFPFIQTFRITEPQNYARTVFIEALMNEGVVINTNVVGPNPIQKLPPQGSYTNATKLAELVSLPYSEYARLILKVSYNIGADTSLILYGLTQGEDSMEGALQTELTSLDEIFGIKPSQYNFVDGSGGGESTATNKAVTKLMISIDQKPYSGAFFNALPILGVDGSLAFVTDFTQDASLAGAVGNVRAKTGTFIEGQPSGPPIIRAQALGGYVISKSGKKLAFQMVVNDAGPFNTIDDITAIFQDQGRIAAIIWRDN